MPLSKDGRTRHAGAEPTQKLGLLPNCVREASGAGLEEPLDWLETLCPSGQGDGLEIHEALPAGARIRLEYAVIRWNRLESADRGYNIICWNRLE